MSGGRRCRNWVAGCAIAAVSLGVCLFAPAAVRASGYEHYFGDVHAHTAVSDGSGTPAGAFWSARASGLDFFVVTDHATMISAKEWRETAAAAAAATEAGGFAALTGFELNWYYDHVNVLAVPSHLTPGAVPHARMASAADYEDVVASIPGAIGQFNHPRWGEWSTPAWTMGGDDFEDFDYCTPARDAAMELIEVYNHDCLLDYHSSYESSYVKCLDKGWHVMPSAGGDTHSIVWDNALLPYEYRTVLLAGELTPVALSEAMKAHRGYATVYRDLRISFSVDGAIMGSVVRAGTTHSVSVHVDDPDILAVNDELRALELVGSGGVVLASVDVCGHAASWAGQVSEQDSSWAYLRVTAADGVAAWTAPVWFEG